MFSSAAYVNDVLDIPSNWIFETYLGIPALQGQRVRIKSVFNPNDNSPSMFIFFSEGYNAYMYKCFSTGRSGGAVGLMQQIWGKDFTATADKIRADYSAFMATGNRPRPIVDSETGVNWKVTHYEVRSWTQDDADFWVPINIGSTLLGTYFVKPLQYYFMKKESDDVLSQVFKVTGPRIYGYFTATGELFKVYQPGRTPKALKVKDHIQGIDQRDPRNKTLILTSSYKDIMAVRSLNIIRADLFANDSESVYFTRKQLQEWFEEYDYIVTYMDSDNPGVEAMKYYRDTYGLPAIYIPLEKDPSDLNKFRGIETSKAEIVPKLLEACEKYRLSRETIREKLYIL